MRTTKRLIALFAVTLVIAGAFSGSASLPAAKAQTSAVGVPQGFTVLPPDLDRSDDEIIQLNNLTIKGLSSGSVPATIYAAREYDNPCIKYYSTTGSGVAYPCPLSMAPSVLYQIQVNPETILLLKNRTRASLGTFAVGDHINVFGFFDADSQYMQALIVRDLDKPSPLPVDRYVQLNNMTLISDPSSSYPPATFMAADAGQPCWYYSGPAGYRTSIGGCPIPAASFSMPPVAPNLLPYPTSRIYTVQVTGATRLLDFSRIPLPLSEFRMGDRVNIFGLYRASTNTVEALILRDLGPRIGPPFPGSASLTVAVTNRVECFAAPCNPVPEAGASVEVRSSTGSVTTQITDSAGRTYFTGLAAGTYQVSAYGSNRKATAEISLSSGEQRQISLELGSSISQPTIRVISPNGGETWMRGSVQTIRWEDKLANSQSSYELRLAPYYPPCTGVICPSYPYRSPYIIAKNVTGSSYVWTVGNASSFGETAGIGSYVIEVCSGGICDASDAHFTISNDAVSGVQLSSISPPNAPLGATITLYGSGFTSINNTIYMNGQRVADLASADGRTIVYSNVGYPAWYCPPERYCATVQPAPLPSGTYQVTVVNANGSSNSFPFVLGFITTGFSVSTVSPSAVGKTTATLRGSITPQEFGGSYWFEYGTSPSALSRTTLTQFWSGFPTVEASQFISELSPGTTYYYRIVAKANSGATVSGGVLSFTTSY